VNRSAYLTTGMAIKTLSKLSRANVSVHGQEYLPKTAAIYVVNHFTRLETFLLPYHIFTLTSIPVWSLAMAGLFQGGFGRFLELVGAVSTKAPERDELIIKTLLTGEANWIIFPEGSMIKTKKIIHGGKYMVTHPKGIREPHTGAATLALRAELFKRYLAVHASDATPQATCSLDYLGLESAEEVGESPIPIVPVNLTYYPLRAKENLLSELAEKLVKGVPGRVVEELMTEGTMLLSGVDVDIRFGPPIDIAPLAAAIATDVELLNAEFTRFIAAPVFHEDIQKAGKKVMQEYMHQIYSMTTVNHDHLFGSFLRLYPYPTIKIKDLQRRVFYAASLLKERKLENIFLHKSLEEEQSHLVVDDRYHKVANFIELATSTGVVSQNGKTLTRDRTKLTAPVSFHRGRIENPVEVIANEVEPLQAFQKFIYSLSWQPDMMIRLSLFRYLLQKAKRKYQQEVQQWGCELAGKQNDGAPLFFSGLKGLGKRVGVLLIHSYLSVPGEMEAMGRYLKSRGYWVYIPRLSGHGTCAEGLSACTYSQWVEDVDSGYALLDNICDQVVVGGMSVGGSLAMYLAARSKEVAGVFSLCSPLRLKDYSTRFMPAKEAWKRLLKKIRGGETVTRFLEFSADKPYINYHRNPVAGIKEVGKLLEELEDKAGDITAPALILHADGDPVVGSKGSQMLFERISSRRKEYGLLHYDHHIIVKGNDQQVVFGRITDFLDELTTPSEPHIS